MNTKLAFILFTAVTCGCTTSYYLTPEMRQTCDGLRYSPSSISEISTKYSDTTGFSPYSLSINADSTYREVIFYDLGPTETSHIGKCSLIKDTLRFIILKIGSWYQFRDITETEKQNFYNSYQRRNYYLIKKLNGIIYLIRSYQEDDFCDAVLNHKSKREFFQKTITD